MNLRFVSSNKIAANIPKFYLFNIAWMFWLVYAINVVFYRMNNISVSQITIIDVVWSLAAFAMEVPTGVLSDRWSRKYMLVLSSLFASFGFLIFGLSSTFIPFAVATIFMAARHSFASGTSNALLYDSLKVMKRENEFEKILGRSKLLGILSISIAGIIGSYLAKDNIRVPFLLSIFSSGLAALIAFFFKEPKVHSSTEEVKLFDHIKRAGKLVLTHPFIRFVFFYLVLMDIAISYLDEYDQLYLTAINFPLVWFGAWIALRRGLGGLGGFFAERLKDKSSVYIKAFALLIMIVSLGMITLGSKYVGLAAFLLIFPIWGIAEVLIWGEIHSQVKSYQRATVESFITFFGVILDTPARLGFGYVSQGFGIRIGYLYVMILLLVYSPYFLLKRTSLVSRVKAVLPT